MSPGAVAHRSSPATTAVAIPLPTPPTSTNCEPPANTVSDIIWILSKGIPLPAATTPHDTPIIAAAKAIVAASLTMVRSTGRIVRFAWVLLIVEHPG